MPPSTDMSPPQAADVIGCSAPTVRALIANGHLRATATKKGTRTFFTISSEDLADYVGVYGAFQARNSRRLAATTGGNDSRQLHDFNQRSASLVDEVRALRKLIEDRPARQAGDPSGSAELVALREVVQLQRAAMAELLDADSERATGTLMMQQAIASFERADSKRRNAIAILDEIVGSLTLPGTTEPLEERPLSDRRG